MRCGDLFGHLRAYRVWDVWAQDRGLYNPKALNPTADDINLALP